MQITPITIYTKKNCPLCDKAFAIVADLKKEFPIEIDEVDIYSDDDLLEKYMLTIPVIEFEKEEIDYGLVSKDKVRQFLVTLQK
jgi:glutaredoxin